MATHYKELVVWQKAVALVEEVYRVSTGFPEQERFGLCSQVRRAAVSVPSNIAEGQGRLSVGEFKQFLGHARGSLFEVETQLLIARRLGFLSDEQMMGLSGLFDETGRLLNGLIRSLRQPS